MSQLPRVHNLTNKDLKLFWKYYLTYLSKSIKIGLVDSPDKLLKAEGWGDPLGKISWDKRVNIWYRGDDNFCYCIQSRAFVQSKYVTNVTARTVVPMFGNYVKASLDKLEAAKAKPNETTQDNKPKQEDKAMVKNTLTSLTGKNKEAMEVTGKLVVGKTANSFFLSKLLGKFPWYVKLFSKKKDATSNPLAKFAAAQTALALTTHFASDNKKLNYIAEAMVTEAMVDMTVNSNMLENIMRELEDLITLPESLSDK